jgi:DNA helicase HerA-like ATPase
VDLSPQVGRVIGTEDSTPLEFWVGVEPGQFLQLDDVVALDRVFPSGELVSIYGVVSQVRARHDGARFDSDVFLIEQGLLPAETSESANVLATRFEPEIFAPPRPGTPVRKAAGSERERALFFEGMTTRVPAGLSRSDEPFYINLEFIDGTRGAHVNISGVSGVATKTTYAMFLLNALFQSGVLGTTGFQDKALVFNVKSEDLMYLDQPNVKLAPEQAARYRALGIEPAAFPSVEFWAPPRPGDPNAAPQTERRHPGVHSFFWTIFEFCRDDLLQFLFVDVSDERQQYPMVVHAVMAQLRKARKLDDGAVTIEGAQIRDFSGLVDFIANRLEDPETQPLWAGRAITPGTTNAFIRRLHGAIPHLKNLVRADVARPEEHSITRQKQITVVDIHNLNQRAQRFVVGVVLYRMFQKKEAAGTRMPLEFIVLDELNKYAPREGSSPIKEILLDVAERGRSLGMILFGAQQTASEVERRITANAAIRVVGRLDSAESGRDEYGFLPQVQRQRATIMKPGTMIVSQPELPVPMVVEFPFPSWATRADEAPPPASNRFQPEDPLEGVGAPR